MRIKIGLEIPNHIIELMNNMRDSQGVEYKQQIEEAIKLYHIDFPIESVDDVLKEI